MNWFDKGYLPNLLWQQKYKFSPTFPHIYSNYFYLALYFYYYYVCNLQKINHKAVICRIFALGGAFFLGEGLSPSRFLAPVSASRKGPHYRFSPLLCIAYALMYHVRNLLVRFPRL